jgi:hypothetical protein
MRKAGWWRKLFARLIFWDNQLYKDWLSSYEK